MAVKNKPTAAIAYDFDGTLAPGNMQERKLIPDIGMTPDAFWGEVAKIARSEQADEILVYMSLMLEKARAKPVSVKRNDLVSKGRQIKLFSGLDTWFDRIEQHARQLGLNLEHYLISSGNEELIHGTELKSRFKKIWASKYHYDHHGVAVWPALAVNYTNKTQFLFRINKGTLKPNDREGVNKFIETHARPVPFENMIYIGDGETDIPCFRLIKDLGGCSIAVYKPNSRKKQQADQLLKDGRVHCAVPADYSEGKKLEERVIAKLKEVAAREDLLRKLK